MKIQSLEKKLEKIGSKIEGQFFTINSKPIKILKSEENVFGFAYNQGEDDAIIFNNFNQVLKHFANKGIPATMYDIFDRVTIN